MTETVATLYDDVPYPSYAFPECHPDRLATVATLYGLTPPRVESCRLLEIGCASGANLVPLAYAMPRARFVGIDLSSRQIADARTTSETLKLQNVEFQAMSLADIDEGFGQFDYVLCHGVYSWVPRALQDKILDIIGRNLVPHGIAYVSYNTLPGWRFAGLVRELMLYRVAAIADPEQKAQTARSFLDELIRALPEPNAVYAQFLRQELDRLRVQSDSYILHEHLEEVNEALYFHEFVDRVESRGLCYVGDARYRSAPECQSPRLKAIVEQFSGGNRVGREQYHDFLRNRSFRRSLLGRGGREPSTTIVPESVDRLRALSASGPASPRPDTYTASSEEFRSPDGQNRISTSSPSLKMTLMVLGEAWPASLPVPELRSRVQERLARPPVPNAAPFDASPVALAQGLLQCFVAGLVEFSAWEPGFATRPAARPLASRYARIQAADGRRVVSLRHRNVELTEFERLVVRQLDGRRDHAAIVDALAAAVADGSFVLHQGGQPITDLAIARPILDRSLPPCLDRLAASALLEPS
jgi:methyltransferase-like protein/2-polyprenyl-3-methyl-5-hydroxy-6-metoxy-1,4-benzoquinol methylase